MTSQGALTGLKWRPGGLERCYFLSGWAEIGAGVPEHSPDSRLSAPFPPDHPGGNASPALG